MISREKKKKKLGFSIGRPSSYLLCEMLLCTRDRLEKRFSLCQAKGRQMKLCKDSSDSSDCGSETQEERRDSTDKHVTFSVKPGQTEIYFLKLVAVSCPGRGRSTFTRDDNDIAIIVPPCEHSLVATELIPRHLIPCDTSQRTM